VILTARLMELAEQVGLFGRPATPPPTHEAPKAAEVTYTAGPTVHVHSHIRATAHGYEQVKEHERHVEHAAKEAPREVEQPKADVVDMSPRIIRMSASRLDEFKAAMEKLSKKAEKLGCPPPKYSISEPFDATQKVVQVDDMGNSDGGDIISRVVRAVHVTIEPQPIKLSGWSLAGSFELGGEHPHWSIADWAVGHIPERYRVGKPHCDHCALTRTRKLLFLLKHGSGGEWKQVGGDCVKDFLGHDPGELTAAMGLYDEIRKLGGEFHEEDDGEGGVRRSGRFFPMQETLALALAHARMFGFVSGREAFDSSYMQKQSTGQAVSALLTARGGDAARAASALRRSPLWPKFVEKAGQIIEWGKKLEPGPIGSYQDKLRLIFQSDQVEARDITMAVSALSGFERESGRKALENVQGRAREVGHLGKPGDKIGTKKLSKKDREAGVTLHPPRELECIGATTKQGNYGTTHILKFVDAEGHMLTWFASNGDASIEHAMFRDKPETQFPWSPGTNGEGRFGMYVENIEPGRRYLLESATIKAHDTYRDDPQTIITRGSILPMPSEGDIRFHVEPRNAGGQGYTDDLEAETQFTMDLGKKQLAEAGVGAIRFPDSE
jgi:hypothetical protein